MVQCSARYQLFDEWCSRHVRQQTNQVQLKGVHDPSDQDHDHYLDFLDSASD